MNLKLRRTSFTPNGIFGNLFDESNNIIAVTLEHSYANLPKLPPGTYSCVRGQHILPGMSAPFTTFEITGVPGHSQILFHVGNYNFDSQGCVLLGTNILGSMIINSKLAFEKFLQLQNGVDSFTLTVS